MTGEYSSQNVVWKKKKIQGVQLSEQLLERYRAFSNPIYLLQKHSYKSLDYS